MHKPTGEHSGPPKKPAPYMKIQMTVKLPRLSMRHQPLLDSIDGELSRCLSRQVCPPHQKQPHPQPTANPLRLRVTHQPSHQSITCRSFAHHQSSANMTMW